MKMYREYSWRPRRAETLILPKIKMQQSGDCFCHALATTIEARLRLCQVRSSGGSKPFKVTLCPHKADKFFKSCVPPQSDDFQAISRLLHWSKNRGFCSEKFHQTTKQLKNKFPPTLLGRRLSYMKMCPRKFKIVGWFEFRRTDVERIKKEIMRYGPVVGTFLVHEDYPGREFKSFSKIYKATGDFMYLKRRGESGDPIHACHAVVIVGWGSDGETDYWLVQNSYGELWGEGGFHRMKMDTMDRIIAPFVTRKANPSSREISSWDTPDHDISD